MSATAKGPDAMQLDQAGLSSAPFPGKTGGLRVYIEQKTHDALWQHARENTSVEICGVLVGLWKRDAEGPYVHVSASIRGDAATSKFAEVTFTHETWTKINEQMDKQYSDRVIVGWYHTHPDFGVFLSDRDLFIHEHFFSAAGQIAHVIDPIRREEGVFVWRTGKATLTPMYWVGAGQRWAPRPVSDAPAKHDSAVESPESPRIAEAYPVPRWNGLMLLAVGVCLVVAGYMLANSMQRQEQLTIAHALAQQLCNHTSSLEVLQSSKEIRALLSEAKAEYAKLSVPGKEGEQAPKLEAVVARAAKKFESAEREIDRILAAVALRPEQAAALDALVQQGVDQRLQTLVARGFVTVNKNPPPATTAPTTQKRAAESAPAASSGPAKGGH